MGTSVSRFVRDERKAIEEAEDNDNTHLTIVVRNSKELGQAREQLRQKMESRFNAANPLRSVCFRMANVAHRPVRSINYNESSSSEDESDEDEDEEELQDNPTADVQEDQTCSSNEEHTKDNPQDWQDEAPNSDDNHHGGKAQAAEKGKKEEHDDEDSDSEDEDEEEDEEDTDEQSDDEEPPLLKLTLEDQENLKDLFHDLESAPLETIWFDFNDASVINAGPVVSLIKQTRATLKYVSFMQVHMRQNIEDLEEAFQDHPVLEKVAVLNNYQDNVREFSVPARECVVPSVAKCPKLTEVIIEGESVLGLEDLASSASLEKLLIRAYLGLPSPECIAIFDGLRRNQNSTLKHLEILSDSIGCEEDDIQAFNNMLRTNNSIQKLWIPVEYNLLSSIAKALESNKKVSFLNLHFLAYKGDHYDKQPLAVQAMLDMVKVNTTLEDVHHLPQDGNPFDNPWEVDGMKGKREIHWYLRLNAAGRGKLLNNEGATIEDLLHSINYVKNCPSSIFYFLQNNLSFIVEALQKDSANSDDERPAKKRKVTAGP